MNEIVDGFFKAVELIVTLNPEVIEISARSLMITSSAVVIGTAISIPIGLYIAYNDFFGKKAIINLIQTLYALPTVIIGLLVYMMISRQGPFGFLGLIFTSKAIVIGQVILVLPILIGLTISALSGIDPTIRDTITSLGATKLQFMRTIIREARFAIYAAVVMAFGRAISEVGAAIMIGGNMSGHTRILTTSIALETSMGNIEFSMALGMILLSIALIVNTFMTFVQQS